MHIKRNKHYLRGFNSMHRNSLRFLIWYAEHLENEVFLLFAGFAIGIGYAIYFMIPLAFPWSWIVPIAISALLYFYMKRLVNKKLYQMIRDASKDFSKKPTFRSKTTEELIEAIDLAIMSAIKEIGGNYVDVVPNLASTFDSDEVIVALGKLTSQGRIKAYSNRIALTAEGMETLSIPPASLRFNVPAEIAERIAKSKALMKSGNFNGVVDEINKLFEYILRDAFIKHGNSYGKKWDDLRIDGKVRRGLSKAGLGELLSACREVRIFKRDTFFENLILAFLKIRTPGKHDTGKAVVAEANAQTALSLAKSFLRHWYL